MPRPITNADQLPLAESLLAAGFPVRVAARRTKLDRSVVRRRRDALGIEPHVAGPRYPFNERAFDRANADEAMAYWAGFLLADGSVYTNAQGGQLRVKLALAACDAAHVARFNEWLGRSGPVLTSSARVRAGGPKFATASVEVSSDRMAADLAAWGVIRDKTLCTAIPSWLQRRPDLLRHWLRGYFDGDGHVSVHGPYPTKPITRTMRITGHGPFLTEVANHLARKVPTLAGVWCPQPRQSRPTDAHRHIQWSALSDLERLHAYLYAGATIWLPRKRDAFDKAITVPGLRPRRR